MARIEQRSFSGGEISPALYGRTDIAKYQSSMSLMRNWYVQVHGGASTRAGFEFIGHGSDFGLSTDVDALPVRLIEFQFNTEQNYILCFGENQMRVIRNGEFVVEGEIAISSVTNENQPLVTTAEPHGLLDGDEVFLSDVTGMTELNERLLVVINASGSTFRLKNVDSTGYGTFTAGNMAKLYNTASPYAAADLPLLKFTQSADVMTLTHPNYPAYELTRTQGEPNSVWTIKAIEFGSTLKPPVLETPVTAGTDSGSAPKDYGYVVTAVDNNGSETVASNGVEINMNAQGNTWGAKMEWNQIQGATQADPVVITMAGHPYANGDRIKLKGVGGMTELNDNIYQVTKLTDDTFSLQNSDGDNIDGTGFTAYTSGGYANYATSAFFNVYKLNSVATGIYGYIGQSENNEFTDFNLGPDMSVTPPTNNNPFEVDGDPNYPFCTSYHQQRLWFGGVMLSPQTIFASKSGDFKNFDLSNPVRSDDSIEVTLATRQVNELRHLVSIGPLIALTSGGVWRIDGDADGVITPKAISTQNQGERGCSHVPPVLVGDTVLFIQALNGKIRDLSYEFESNKYTGDDLTLFAEHLFYGYQIVDWCFSEEPNSLIWCVRSDGKLLSLAYLKEQNVWGWSQHDTDGFFESVASVSEGNEDVVYAVVRREVDGVQRRFVERLRERRFVTAEDSFCVDSGLTYKGAETDTVIGLEHLEGRTLVGLADGEVVENLVVSNGQVTLPYAASTIHVGLPYTCDMQTLEVTVEGQTLRTRKKAIPRVGLLVRDTRGLKIGSGPDRLYEIKEREASFGYGAIPSYTGERTYQADINWQNEGGLMFIRQDYPLPATILSLIPELTD